MSKVMVRYTVKPERAEENAELVRAVYEELGRSQPDDLRYVTFRLDDGVTFVHVGSNETPDGRSPLLEVEAFRHFLRDLRERCEEPPVFTELEQIGAYRVAG